MEAKPLLKPYKEMGKTELYHSPSLCAPMEEIQETATEKESDQPRSYWRWSKTDFFPEPSFQNWATYKTAITESGSRFKDRFLNRSTDSFELNVLQKQSENTLHRCLTWWDLMWLSFGSVVGTGIFVLTGQEAHNHAGSAIVISYAISGLSALLSVFCYTEFAVEVPVAGGSFSYLRIELGDFVAFIAAGNILLEAVVGAAGLARSWTSYFATIINRNPDSLRIHISSFAEGYNMLDPIAVVVLLITNTIAMLGTRGASKLNWIASLVTVALIVFIVIAGCVKGSVDNLTPFAPYGAGGIFQAAAVLFWAYTGFDMVATMAEETKKPEKDIPIGLIGSMSMITIVYCLMALSLSMMQKYTEIDVNAAYSVAFQSVGMKWAKYLVAAGALKGMTTGLIVGGLGQARYTTQIARSHMIPPWFALVHPKTGTPIYAALLVTICSACVALFSSLDVLSSVSSLSTLFIFMLMAVALIVRRYNARNVSSTVDRCKLGLFLFMIIGSSIGTSVYYSRNANGWIGHMITIPIWVLGNFGIMIFLPQQHFPKVWGVPLVPWLPSLSIGLNLFLIGSLGSEAFVRFGICTLVMLAYYLFCGLHATYDVAHQKQDDPGYVQDANIKGKTTDETESGTVVQRS
ncbi:cationic amino acid transporter 5-like isoform X2 [Papaver somniferum]|uniref:cationic amino acid transporter 5-like isoform X2 n=1 Tax=Papaver somniferum TaxID=3469 RepID=UPI000E705C06|nr:cationic amino acid transporter 5-like isoform X2 [Papaver somniferum]